jgi:hypothetical protein
LASSGLTMPPGGVPVMVSCTSLRYMTPARRNFQSKSLVSLSATRFLTVLIHLRCGIVSKDSTTYYPCRQLTRWHPGNRDRSRSDSSPLWQTISRRLSPHSPGCSGHASAGIFAGHGSIASAPARYSPDVNGAGCHQTHSRRRGGACRDGSSVGLMAIRPAVLWGLLPEELKQTIASDLKTILSEVLYQIFPAHFGERRTISKS